MDRVDEHLLSIRRQRIIFFNDSPYYSACKKFRVFSAFFVCHLEFRFSVIPVFWLVFLKMGTLFVCFV